MAKTPLPSSHVIRARRIELVDEHGEIKITLDAQETGSVIRLWGKDGRIRASFGLLTSDRPAVLFWDSYIPRVDLRLEEDGQPNLGFVQNRHTDACELFIENAKWLERQARREAKKGQTKARTKA